jgi:hypothetical protein
MRNNEKIELELSNFTVKRGGFSVVILDYECMTALKIFKSYLHPDFDGTGKNEIGEEKTNEYHRKVFKSQINAYNSAQYSNLLLNHIPKFYGERKLDFVYENGIDVSNQFLLDCCYQIELICGEEGKLNLLMNNKEICNQIEMKLNINLNSIVEEFHNNGIQYTLDASFIYNDLELKIIDFASEDSHNFEPIIYK